MGFQTSPRHIQINTERARVFHLKKKLVIASVTGENNFQVTLFYQTKLTSFEHIKKESETDALKIFLLKKKFFFETSKIIMSSVRERNMQHDSIGKT